MARCTGTTKAGNRCKRDASEGSDYCAAHADQADAPSAGARTGAGKGADLILVAAVALALAALRRVIRLI